MILFLVGHAAAFVVLSASFFAAGRRALPEWKFSCVAEELAVSLGLGAGIWGTALFALALMGRLGRLEIGCLAVGVQLAAIPVWRDVLRRARARRGTATSSSLFFSGGAGIALLAVPSLVLSLYPPTAFDETLYHLPIARALATAHSVGFETNLRNPVFPELVESLHAAMLLFFDDSCTHLVEGLALAATALALYGFGRKWGSGRAGFLAAAFWVGSPLVVGLGAYALVDLDLTLFFTLAYLAWESGRASGDRRWLTLAWAFAGFAAATKYLGLWAPLMLAALTLLFGAGRRGRVRIAAAGLALSGAVLALTYGWIFAETRNPVFPFLPRLFGHTEWDKAEFLKSYGEDASAWSALWMPWRISPLWLGALAVAAIGAVRAGRPRRALLAALAYGIPLLKQDPRFLLPSLALLAASAGWSAAGFRYPNPTVPPRRFAAAGTALAGAILLAPAYLSAARVWRWIGPVPTSPAARDAFLRRRVAGYGAVAWLNSRPGPPVRAYFLFGENLKYFAGGELLGDWSGPWRYGKILPSLRSPRRLDRTLGALGCRYFGADLETSRRLSKRAFFPVRFERVYAGSGWVVWERRGGR